MRLRRDHYKRFVHISCLPLIEEVLDFIEDREIVFFCEAARRTRGEVPLESLRRTIEFINRLYWEHTDLRGHQRKLLHTLHARLLQDLESAKTPGPLTLEEIRQRQLERRRQLKSSLIKIGAQRPDLRPHIKRVLTVLRQKRNASVITGETKLTAQERRRINNAFRKHGFDGRGRFDSVGQALSLIWDILWDEGISPLSGGFTNYAYSRDEGQTHEYLGRLQDQRGDTYLEITNSLLAFQWYTFDVTDQVEVLAYLS